MEGDHIAGLFWLVILGAIYFIPTIIAVRRNHKNGTPIFITNLVFGWTLIGWVGTLVWSLMADQERKAMTHA